MGWNPRGRLAAAGFLIIGLMGVGAVAPAAAYASPKTIASGFPSSEALAADNAGNIYFVSYPNFYTAQIWEMTGMAATPRLVYSLTDNTVSFASCFNGVLSNGVTISELHFNARGDVYFILSKGYSQGGNLATLNDSTVELNPMTGSATTIASYISTVDVPLCQVGSISVVAGTVIEAITTNSAGAVYTLLLKYNTTANADYTQLTSTAPGAVGQRLVATLPGISSLFSLNVDSSGDAFFSGIAFASGTISLFMVKPSGAVVTLLTSTTVGYDLSAMSPSGNLYYLQFCPCVSGHYDQFSIGEITNPGSGSQVTPLTLATLDLTITPATFYALQLGDSDALSVGESGAVFFALSLYNDTQSPNSLVSTLLYGVAPNSGAAALILNDANRAYYPPFGMLYNALGFATVGNNLLYSDWAAGTINLVNP